MRSKLRRAGPWLIAALVLACGATAVVASRSTTDTVWVHGQHHDWVARSPGGEPIGGGSIEEAMSTRSMDVPIAVCIVPDDPILTRVVNWSLGRETVPELVEFGWGRESVRVDGDLWYRMRRRE